MFSLSLHSLRVHESLRVAAAVATQIDRAVKPASATTPDAEIHVRVASNMREQLLAFTVFQDAATYFGGRTALVGQHRSSDDIVVYFGDRVDFDPQTLLPRGDDWPAQHFPHDRPDLAAGFVLRFLNGPSPV